MRSSCRMATRRYRISRCTIRSRWTGWCPVGGVGCGRHARANDRSGHCRPLTAPGSGWKAYGSVWVYVPAGATSTKRSATGPVHDPRLVTLKRCCKADAHPAHQPSPWPEISVASHFDQRGVSRHRQDVPICRHGVVSRFTSSDLPKHRHQQSLSYRKCSV